jgi:hypothetical protein
VLLCFLSVISWAIKNTNAKVFANEAAPRKNEKLKEDIEINKLSNMKYLNFAAGATFESLYFPYLISSKFTGSEREEATLLESGYLGSMNSLI